VAGRKIEPETTMARTGERHTMERVTAVVATSSHVRTRTTYGLVKLSCGHAFSAVLHGRLAVGARRRCHQCRTGQPVYLSEADRALTTD
jgi:hypothetical protein